MTKDELGAGWARLKEVYAQMPALNAGVGKEWLRVLQPFSGADLDLAIDRWIAKERYKPTPADMARLCRVAQRERQANELAAEITANGECPICGGTGFVWHFLEPDERDRVICCQCPKSPNREQGAEILRAAFADEGWVFDKVDHGFRRRREWVGNNRDDRPMGYAAQSLLEKGGAAVWTRMNARR